MSEQTLGKDHPSYGIYLSNLANLYWNLGQNERALEMYRKAIENIITTLGREHPLYGTRLNNLAAFSNRIIQIF